MEKFEKQYKVEIGLRKRYWNQLEDAKGKVRVYARIRPLSKNEMFNEEGGDGSEIKVHVSDETRVEVSERSERRRRNEAQTLTLNLVSADDELWWRGNARTEQDI